MSVHYKFKSALEYDTVTFDGLHISVKDLKNSIIQQKRIGKSTDFDLQVTNAQTKEVYEDENALIPKNTSLLIARIPVISQKTKQWEGYGGDNTPPVKSDEGGPIAKAVDLSSLDAPEDDKIRAMMSQSTQDYDPSNYMKIRGANQMGAVPPTYKCYKCHQGGHWIKDCTFGQGADPVEIKKSTGIPRSFMVAVEGPQVPGAMMTPYGQFAVPLVDHQAYNHKSAPQPVPEPKHEIPEDLVCSICSDLLTDAVMIPCCGNSFCDECVRGVLLESEDHECPDCHEKDILPDTLIPNRFLRTSVANFKNTTGYVKKSVFKEIRMLETPQTHVDSQTPPPRDLPMPIEEDTDKGPVISEADSTEPVKNHENESSNNLEHKDPEKSAETESVEGPPGVSPRRSPKLHRKHKDDSPRDTKHSPRERRIRHRNKGRSSSPIKNSRHRRSRSYSGSRSPERRRSGTPTVDEPPGKYIRPPGYNSAPTGSIPTVIGQINPIQSIPGNYPPGQPLPMGNFPPTQGPPPNYRFPPPGGAPSYMPPGHYNVPPRPMFDATRPPMSGPPPNFNPNFPPGSRGHRDYRRMMDRAPPGVIDDPLAAFNRLLREKDEQKRRAKQRGYRRGSYSRSRSRSRSFSRSPVRRRLSRSPRPMRRLSRSRSRSFSLSRSRSRSFSGSPLHRQLSPARRSSPHLLLPRRGPSRYRSPIRSPLRTRHRDNEDDRDFGRRNRENRNIRRSRERDRGDRFFDDFDDKRGVRQQQPWSGGHQNMPPRLIQETGYYPPPIGMQQGYQTNRYIPPRDYGPPFNQPLPQTIHSIQPHRQYQDIAPPGVDDDIAPPGVEELPIETEKKVSPRKEDKEKAVSDKRTDRRESDKKRRHDKKSRTPDRARNPSPKRKSKSKDRDSPDKRRRKRRESTDHSDDEKNKKSKDKKKHKDKKESEKKKKRDKKDKHKKETKEKKSREEFKQIIPKNVPEEDEEVQLKNTKKREEESQEDLLEERRLEALRYQKRQEEEKMFEKKNLASTKEKKSLEDERRREEREKQRAERKREELRKLKEREQRFSKLPKKSEETISISIFKEVKPDLYGEISKEDIDTKVVEQYGRLENDLLEERLQQELLRGEGLPGEHLQKEDGHEEDSQPPKEYAYEELIEEGEIQEYEEEKDILELHTTDLDLKHVLDKSDILAPVPEKSKWEVDEDGVTSPKDSNKSDTKSDKSGKVTNEVLKRAENAIFAKAINAIRPIEIKKIGGDRAKLYSGERDQITIVPVVVKNENIPPPVRLSVKERLGVKVDDTDKIINLSRRSKTVSPFSKRGESGRNVAAGERRIEVDENKNSNRRSRSRRTDNSRDVNRNRSDNRHNSRNDKRNERKGDRSKIKTKPEKNIHADEEKKPKRKRSRTRSVSEERRDKNKKKDKKQKKEKLKNKDSEGVKHEKEEKGDSKPSQVAAKRKATIDEANFEPDYDESHSEEDEQKEKMKISKKESESSSSESDSDSSSEEERKKKKHKKRKKKKRRETSSSSSSSSSESESSESEKERKKKKHKKTKKKKKKSKHK